MIKFAGILLATVALSGCLVTVDVTGVRSDGCAWTSDLYLSKPSIKALREAQVDNPEIRVDREKIVTHNRLWAENCPPEED